MAAAYIASLVLVGVWAVAGRQHDGTGLVALATSGDSEEFAGAAGDRAVLEKKIGTFLSNNPRDLFSIAPDGSGAAVPLGGPTPNDEHFAFSF